MYSMPWMRHIFAPESPTISPIEVNEGEWSAHAIVRHGVSVECTLTIPIGILTLDEWVVFWIVPRVD